jgi:hypothetical protein
LLSRTGEGKLRLRTWRRFSPTAAAAALDAPIVRLVTDRAELAS